MTAVEPSQCSAGNLTRLAVGIGIAQNSPPRRGKAAVGFARSDSSQLLRGLDDVVSKLRQFGTPRLRVCITAERYEHYRSKD